MRAKTRWTCAERNENPARNRAGDTDAPTPKPMSAAATATSALAPAVRPVSSAAPAASTARPLIASTGANRVRNRAPNGATIIARPASAGQPDHDQVPRRAAVLGDRHAQPPRSPRTVAYGANSGF